MTDGRPRRLNHFTPLRYPGGKGKLAPYVKSLIRTNGLVEGEYVEPYAGGAAIAMELLLQEYVSRVHINDVSRPVWAFWDSVIRRSDDLCRLIRDTPRTVDAWDVHKRIMMNQAEHEDLDVGFAMFFLNRTNRSGILNAGVIGGRAQTGAWKIDARYNAEELIYRVQSIANVGDRVSLTKLDAVEFLRQGVRRWPSKTLIYCDPPYYVKGRDLYYDFYHHADHERVAAVMQSEVSQQRWIVSYDNVAPIQELYARSRCVTYNIGYSARSARQGAEIMFFCEDLEIPSLTGAIQAIDETAATV